MGNGLVLSVFPGIDLLGRAFEEEAYCVVRGPDLLWGGDIRNFHPPSGVFEGVIGGPPCQPWTRLQFLNPKVGEGMQWVVSEFTRVVEETAPIWFLMENVPYAPMPIVRDYRVFDVLLADEDVGGTQRRQRRFTFGTPDGRMLYVVYHEHPDNGRRQSVLADARAVPVKLLKGGKEKRSILSSGPGSQEDACEAMGLPRDFTKHMPFTMHGKRSVIGNGVPMAMGRAIAKAVRRATDAAAAPSGAMQG